MAKKASRSLRPLLTLRSRLVACCLVGLLGSVLSASGQQPAPMALYDQIRAFTLGEQVVRVENLAVNRDRVELTFTGEFYFAGPTAGRVCGAVFLGQGRLRVVPSTEFERDNVRRLLRSDVIEATFASAVLRFTDDTYQQIASAAPPSAGGASLQAQKLAAELEDRLVRETGLNLSARLTQAVLDREAPGVFFGEFEGGKPSRFSVLLDYQTRALARIFGINGGEKGLVYQYRGSTEGTDVWTAFASQEDIARGEPIYSDDFNLVDIPVYRMEIDATRPDDWLRYDVEMELAARRDAVSVIPFNLNEGLGEFEQERLKKGLQVVSATRADGAPLAFIQLDWETGFSLLLPEPLRRDEKITVRLRLEGKDALWDWLKKFYYLRSNSTWYPRHGDLAKSHFELRFRHRKQDRIIAPGERVAEGPSENNPEEWVTVWRTREPIDLASFAVGLFKRQAGEVERSGRKVPLELYDAEGYAPVKQDFVLAELGNGINYFSENFGEYRYGRLGAVFFPAPFGLGYPTMLFLPVEGYAHTREFAFVAHEVAHQWWGNMVTWRSYRDQWLSEGFAEYSGAIYAWVREKKKGRFDELLYWMRENLEVPPGTDVGVGSGRLHEVGPLVLGHRLSTRKTRGAYTTLIYDKGALVLRMVHFLLSNPSDQDDAAFFAMMKDFVARHRDRPATTESFVAVATEHFVRTPIARKYRLQDLDWFVRQWVHQTALPSYRLEYRFEPVAGGGVMVRGTLFQENAPDDWFMVLPLVFEFSGNRSARGTIHAQGPSTPVEVRLPEEPLKLKLDPERWVLSEKVTEKRVK